MAERRPGVRLVAFDLDGTVVRGPEINCGALIGKALGHPEWTEQTEPLYMRDASDEERSARLAPFLAYSLDELCLPLKRAELAPGTKEALAVLREAGVATALVSLAWDFVVEWFARELGADYSIASRFDGGRAIAPLWPEEKGRRLLALAAGLGLERDELAAVGDSIRDESLLRAVGRPFYVGDPLPKELADIPHLPDGDLLEVVTRLLT